MTEDIGLRHIYKHKKFIRKRKKNEIKRREKAKKKGKSLRKLYPTKYIYDEDDLVCLHGNTKCKIIKRSGRDNNHNNIYKLQCENLMTGKWKKRKEKSLENLLSSLSKCKLRSKKRKSKRKSYPYAQKIIKQSRSYRKYKVAKMLFGKHKRSNKKWVKGSLVL